MTFIPDNRNIGTLTEDSRNANGTFTNDSQNLIRVTWGSEILTWAQELHTWGEMVSSFSQDIRN